MNKRIIALFLSFALVLPVHSISFAEGENLVSGKNVFASSRYSDNHDPHNITDGNEKTFWSTGSDTNSQAYLTGKVQNKQYITVDLGQKYILREIILRSRRDIDRPGERSGYTIEVSNDKSFAVSSVVGSVSEAGEFKKDDAIISVELDEGYRYIRVSSKATMSMSEMEVYGEPDYDGIKVKDFEDSVDTEFYGKLTLLQHLKIIGSYSRNEFGADKLINREEAAAITARFMNNGNIKYDDEKLYFKDVGCENEFYNEIRFCAENGILSASEYFRPDEAVTATEMQCMLLKAMGYSQEIIARGGYPAGVLKTARKKELDLAKVLKNANVSRKDAVNLIFNALCAPVAEISGVKNEKLEVTAGKNASEVFFGLDILEGYVSANSVTNELSYDYNENSVVIGGEKYIDENNCAFDLLGHNVYYARYSENQDKLYFAFKKNETSDSVIINCSDITKADNLTIKTSDGKRYNLQQGFTVIKNNVVSNSWTYDWFVEKDGYVELICADKGSNYTMVKLYQPIYVPVYSVSEDDDRVCIKSSNNSIEDIIIDDEIFVRYVKNGKETGANAIKEEQVISVYKSDNDKCYEIRMDNTNVGGECEAIGEDEITIDGISYGISSFYKLNKDNMTEIKPGSNVRVSVNEFNEIVYVFENTPRDKDEHLAFIQKAYLGKGISSEFEIRVFVKDGVYSQSSVKHSATVSYLTNVISDGFIELVAKDKVFIDGKIYKVSELNKKFNEDYFNGKLALITFEQDHTVKKIYTENYVQDEYEDMFTKKVLDSKLKYYSGTTSIYDGHKMKQALDDSACALIVPTVYGKIATDPSYDEFFKFTKPSSIFSNNNAIGNCTFYGDDGIGRPEYIVKKESYTMYEKSVCEPVESAGYSILVDKVIAKRDSDDNYVQTVIGYDMATGNAVEIPFLYNAEKIYNAVKIQHERPDLLTSDDIIDTEKNIPAVYAEPISSLNKGDVIRVSSLIRISSAEKVFNYETPYTGYVSKRGSFYSASKTNTESILSAYRIQYGQIEETKNESVRILTTSTEPAGEVIKYDDANLFYCNSMQVKPITGKEAQLYIRTGNYILSYAASGKLKAVVVYEY